MTTRRKPSGTDQGRKFEEAARELGCDEDEDAFDKVLKEVATAPLPPRPQERRRKTKKRAK